VTDGLLLAAAPVETVTVVVMLIVDVLFREG
jgi:hypothetical protein